MYGLLTYIRFIRRSTEASEVHSARNPWDYGMLGGGEWMDKVKNQRYLNLDIESWMNVLSASRWNIFYSGNYELEV